MSCLSVDQVIEVVILCRLYFSVIFLEQSFSHFLLRDFINFSWYSPGSPIFFLQNSDTQPGPICNRSAAAIHLFWNDPEIRRSPGGSVSNVEPTDERFDKVHVVEFVGITSASV